MIGSYKDITQETRTIIFTNSRKRASGFTPGVFQGMYFEIFISFVHCFGIIIKEKCSPFNQGIIQQPIMYINKVITPMTELSEPPSYKQHTTYYGLHCYTEPDFFGPPEQDTTVSLIFGLLTSALQMSVFLCINT